MQLTGLEAGLLAALVGVTSALVTWLLGRGSYVTKEACRRQHEQECKAEQSLRQAVDILYRMVRSLVVHSNVPPEEQARILNDRSE